MSAWLQVLVTVAGTAAFNALFGAYLYGTLTQKVKDLVGWNKQQDQRLDGHDESLSRNQRGISYIKGQLGIQHGGE